MKPKLCCIVKPNWACQECNFLVCEECSHDYYPGCNFKKSGYWIGLDDDEKAQYSSKQTLNKFV
jgi:hypothetical protein